MSALVFLRQLIFQCLFDLLINVLDVVDSILILIHIFDSQSLSRNWSLLWEYLSVGLLFLGILTNFRFIILNPLSNVLF